MALQIIKWAIIIFVILLIIGAIVPDKWVYSEEELKKMKRPADNNWLKISRELEEERQADRREQYMRDHHITEDELERRFSDYGKREFDESFKKDWEADDYFDRIFDENKMF